jgi:hypothetical protein
MGPLAGRYNEARAKFSQMHCHKDLSLERLPEAARNRPPREWRFPRLRMCQMPSGRPRPISPLGRYQQARLLRHRSDIGPMPSGQQGPIEGMSLFAGALCALSQPPLCCQPIVDVNRVWISAVPQPVFVAFSGKTPEGRRGLSQNGRREPIRYRFGIGPSQKWLTSERKRSDIGSRAFRPRSDAE